MPPLREGLIKRKITEVTNKKEQKVPIEEVKSDSGSDSDHDQSNDDMLNTVNEDGDTTDTDGEDAQSSEGEMDEPIFRSDDENEEDLSFESSSGVDSEDDDDDSEEESNDDESEEEEDSSDAELENNVKKITLNVADKKDKNNTNIKKDLKKNHAKTRQGSKNAPIGDVRTITKTNGEIQNNKKRSETIPTQKKQENKIVSNNNLQNQKKNKQKVEPSKLVDNKSEDVAEKKDEYESSDSSDEEDLRNTVGVVPMHWYNEYPHIGFDWDGKEIMKPPQRDQIEDFLKRCEDPDFWRTIRDPSTGQDVVLSKADLEILGRIRQGKTPDPTYEDYPEWVEWFTSEVLQTPVRAFPEHKRSFLPSALEQRQVGKLVRALRAGWIKTREQDRIDREKKKERKFYMLWSTDDQAEEMRRIRSHIPPPKRALPGHAESYNPPPEYLLDEREMKQWKRLERTPWKRKYSCLPQKYASLREVPAYTRFTRERFLRCLDLYLAPRAIKMRLTIEPEQLVPKLPNPQDLQPFPTVESLVYRGHTDMVRSIDVDPTGQYLYSGSDDGTVKVWEVSTGRCLKTLKLDNGPIKCVQCAPGAALSLIAVACGNRMLLLVPGREIGDHKVAEKTDELLAEAPDNSEYIPEERIRTAVQWETPTSEQWDSGIRISVSHFKEVKQAMWHGRGDYLCAVLPDGANRSVIVHQISRRRSQLPFTKSKGLVQCALFHPIRPYLFVATQRVVRIYDLVKQELVKKLLTSAQWISSIAIHPAGDNLLVATYDKKMMWFDLDMSSKPYQTLRLHSAAVRGVAFHKRYPLFASGSDDRKLIISHGMVYNDLLQNPLIVPLKQMQTHESNDDFGILGVTFHPYQPWVLSAGADCTIRLYT